MSFRCLLPSPCSGRPSSRKKLISASSGGALLLHHSRSGAQWISSCQCKCMSAAPKALTRPFQRCSPNGPVREESLRLPKWLGPSRIECRRISPRTNEYGSPLSPSVRSQQCLQSVSLHYFRSLCNKLLSSRVVTPEMIGSRL